MLGWRRARHRNYIPERAPAICIAASSSANHPAMTASGGWLAETPRKGVMNPKHACATVQSMLAILCALLLAPGGTLAYTPQQSSTPASSQAPAAKIPPDQLDSLVAPIALYPGPAAGPGARGVHISARDHPAAALAREEQEPEGQAAGRRGREAAVGPECAGAGRAFPTSSNGWATTSSGQPTWATPFWRSRRM